MKTLQAHSDRAAIGLSLLCAIHCLATPLAIVLIPSLAALPLEGETFHLWMVILVIPTSIFALTMGCKKHKRHRVAILGGIGLSILIAALLVEGFESGEILEKVLTVIGAAFIAAGHLWNFRLCRDHDNCCADNTNTLQDAQ